MKFLILLHAEEGAWPPEEHAKAIEESVRICQELSSKGQFISAYPLKSPKKGAVVRVRDNKASISDGPYAETKEHLGGYFLVDVQSVEEAIEIAARLPGSRRGTAEIRQIVEIEGLPEGHK